MSEIPDEEMSRGITPDYQQFGDETRNQMGSVLISSSSEKEEIKQE